MYFLFLAWLYKSAFIDTTVSRPERCSRDAGRAKLKESGGARKIHFMCSRIDLHARKEDTSFAARLI